MLTDKHRRNVMLALLFTAKSIPPSFFLMGLPIILRLQGHSLASIGLFQLFSTETVTGKNIIRLG